MKHKTSELSGALLDAAVAKAEGIAMSPSDEIRSSGYEANTCGWRIGQRYSSAWDDGGPIIERERISVIQDAGDGFWTATTKFLFEGGIDGPDGYGPTPLIAAMRAYVAFKLGDEVEL